MNKSLIDPTVEAGPEKKEGTEAGKAPEDTGVTTVATPAATAAGSATAAAPPSPGGSPGNYRAVFACASCPPDPEAKDKES